MSNLNFSQNAVNIIKKYTELSLTAKPMRNGMYSIGYDHTSGSPSGQKYPVKNGTKISQAKADEILREDLKYYVQQINSLLAISPTQNQFDALVSFSYTKGLGFLPSSDVIHFTNTKNFNLAAKEIQKFVYDMGGIKLPKLVKRREEEKNLYLKGSNSNPSTNNPERIGFDVMIRWMEEKRKQGVTYSMDYRMGPNSYDCSSAVYFALKTAGFLSEQTPIGNTDSLFNHLERAGWSQVPSINGNVSTKRGDIFIWGIRGNSGGSGGHTGIFYDDKDTIIHCTCGWNGYTCAVNKISIDNHDQIWMGSNRPPVTVYRFTSGAIPNPGGSSNGGTSGNGTSGNGINPMAGVFVPNRRLPVSGDTNPSSPALAYYEKGESIVYDSYMFTNGYAWISYIAGSGFRRYIAVGPDDGRADTVWGTGFFDNAVSGSGNISSLNGVFYPNKRLPVSGDTNPSSPPLAYYEVSEAIVYDSYVFANGYAWISYVASSGLRRYIAVGPDDGRTDTVWGTGFFDDGLNPGSQKNPNNSGLISKKGVFIPNKKVAVSGDTNPSSPALAYYDAGEAIPYDSYVFVNGYAWISYIAGSGLRRYIAVGPDDGRVDTVWGKGFFN
ncbi:GH24 family phage-related lysozyme (muramidase) [Enterococcus rotai]|uniref:peptidoglycan amidohydrolase family protein n=1 Tax=Enterococcus rotai TaxID=118060 RepID=UPI003398AFE0